MKLTRPKTALEVLRWLVDNPHHEGSIVPGGLRLNGDNVAIIIPRGLVPQNWKRPSDFSKTGRMFEPTPAGHRALNEGQE